MWPLLLFAVTSAWAQDIDLESLKALEEKLPEYSRMGLDTEEQIIRPIGENRWDPPKKPVRWKKIKESGTELGSIDGGIPIVRLEDNLPLKLSRPIYVRFYQLEDENGFKYLVNQDGSTTYRVDTSYVHPIRQELALHEPPLRYTPAPLNRLTHEYDRKLRFLPEVGIRAGYVFGDFMKDLFNDPEAGSGLTNQFSLKAITEWSLPVRIGGAVNYERTSYDLSGGGGIDYDSFSFGPMVETRDFEVANFAYRFQLQILYGPFARAHAELSNATVDFKFNSTDLHLMAEHPVKNKLGEFVLGLFYQVQWLNFKDQPEIVSVRATNKTNKALGLSLSQVFE